MVDKAKLLAELEGLPDNQAYVLLPVDLAKKWFVKCVGCGKCGMKLSCREYANLYDLTGGYHA